MSTTKKKTGTETIPPGAGGSSFDIWLRMIDQISRGPGSPGAWMSKNLPTPVGTFKSGMLELFNQSQRLQEIQQIRKQEMLQDFYRLAQMASLIQYFQQAGETTQRVSSGTSDWWNQTQALMLGSQAELWRQITGARGDSDVLLAVTVTGEATKQKVQEQMATLQALMGGAAPGLLECWRQYLQANDAPLAMPESTSA